MLFPLLKRAKADENNNQLPVSHFQNIFHRCWQIIVTHFEKTPRSVNTIMKLTSFFILSLLLIGAMAFVPSKFGLGSFGKRQDISTESGTFVLAVLFSIIVLSEFDYFPYTFKGRKKRSLRSHRGALLQVISTVDRQNCLLRYICALEAMRREAERDGTILDDYTQANMIFLNIAKLDDSPAVLPFRMAVSTATNGCLSSCASAFNSCPYDATQMQSFMISSGINLI